MADKEKALWKVNRVLLGIIALVFLLAALGVGGVFGYKALRPVLFADSYNRECSQKTDGCGKYGFGKECGIAGISSETGEAGYDKTYILPHWDALYSKKDINSISRDGKIVWFCTEGEAKAAGHLAYYYCSREGSDCI